jgi:hypothetical protein
MPELEFVLHSLSLPVEMLMAFWVCDIFRVFRTHPLSQFHRSKHNSSFVHKMALSSEFECPAIEKMHNRTNVSMASVAFVETDEKMQFLNLSI